MKTLAEMTPIEIITAVREKDLKIIRALVKDLVSKGKYTQTQIREVLEDQGIEVTKMTISRWSR